MDTNAVIQSHVPSMHAAIRISVRQLIMTPMAKQGG